MSMMLEYTFIWSLVGFPAGVFPVTKVMEEEQYFRDHFNDSWTSQINESAKDSLGMPISL